jgi:hypothetical protein
MAILSHLTTQNNLVDRRSKYHSQASHLVRPHQSFHLNTNTRIRHLRHNSRTFINRLNWTKFLKLFFNFYYYYCLSFFFLFLFYSCINSIVTILLSSFSSSSLSLLILYYIPLFSLLTTLSAPSHPLFPLSFPSPSHLPPTCHHTTPPSYTLTTCWLAYSTNRTQPQPPAIPDTNTLYYNNRNTPKHTQGSQNPETLITLNPHTHSFSHPPSFVPPLPIPHNP